MVFIKLIFTRQGILTEKAIMLLLKKKERKLLFPIGMHMSIKTALSRHPSKDYYSLYHYLSNTMFTKAYFTSDCEQLTTKLKSLLNNVSE